MPRSITTLPAEWSRPVPRINLAVDLDSAVTDIVSRGGGVFTGVQPGATCGEKSISPLVLFHPANVPLEKRTTGAIPIEHLSVNAVREKVYELLARFDLSESTSVLVPVPVLRPAMTCRTRVPRSMARHTLSTAQRWALFAITIGAIIGAALDSGVH